MSDRIDLVTVAYPSGLGPIDHPGNRQRVIITLKKKDEEKIKINVAVRSWLRSTGYLVGSGNDYVVWEAKKNSRGRVATVQRMAVLKVYYIERYISRYIRQQGQSGLVTLKRKPNDFCQRPSPSFEVTICCNV